MNITNNFKKLLLLAGDVGVLYTALYLTLIIRYFRLPEGDEWYNHLLPFSFIFIAWILVLYISDLYNLHLAVNNTRFFELTSRSMLIAGLVSVAFFYLNPKIGIAPKTNLVIFFFVFIILFYFWRQFFNSALKSYLPKNNIAIIGLNGQAKEIIKEIANKPHLGYKIAFVVDKSENKQEANQPSLNLNNNSPALYTYHDTPIISSYDSLIEKIKNHKITDIILTSNPYESMELRTELFKCLPLKINYIRLPNFYEKFLGKVPVESINQMWFLENMSEGNKTWFDLFKNLYDLILALLILFASIIFWPIIGILIKLESKGPIFFVQERLGKNSQPFRLFKFRTMREDNNSRTLTTKGDPRITKFGSLLRKTRIDEIPQVINVLKGEMSFIGPRPERPEIIKELKKHIPFYEERMLVKPGLTGWDQVSGEYHSPTLEDSMKKLQYDLFYIKNRSIYLDLSIILKTIATVLSKGGI